MIVKRKSFAKLASILCIILVLSILAPTALATNYEQPGLYSGQMRYTRISVFALDLTISASGKAYCYSSAESTYSTDTVDLTMELQRFNGYTWDTEKSWNSSGFIVASLGKDWYVASGYYYRVYTTARVYSSSGVLLETVPETSMKTESSKC